MKVQEIAPGSAEHLKFLSGFYRAERQSSVFTQAYRELLAHLYNLLIPEDARVLEIGCGAGDLLHRIGAKDKIGIDLSPEQVKRAIRCLISVWPTGKPGRCRRGRLMSLSFRTRS